MKAVVNEDGGTGHGARWGFTFNDITICGKTGTAETKDAKDHALFTGFAPYEDPEIVVTVIIENGGFGGSVAAPVAGNILNEYFKNKQ
jgi:cell division protein FtsI/penicillin-binding protein 2